MRLEERGLLTPARTNAKSGYRYYDNNNIARILQIQKFQWMGFSRRKSFPIMRAAEKQTAFLTLWSRGCPCCNSRLQRCVCVPIMSWICPYLS
ncbi:MerR family transcriptional regulator [bacterium 1xD8-6]|nr:MerR family transcriptional regulator [bacterium D16-36]RKI70033.1 MerR family transcriptional regulator [bacterium 1xD8-6]